ncbi:class II aldolase/adducin family protein [Rugosimonospora acidiphila]
MAETDRQELYEQVATASRILGTAGLARETTGHVSARVGDGRMLLRCRLESEPGLRFTRTAIAEVDFDPDPTDPPGSMRLPIERHIHGQLLRLRPDAGAVVHVHPWSNWLAGIAEIPLRPVMGAFDPGAMAIAVNPPPIYPHSWLISSAERGAQLAEFMAGHDACVLRGHGVVTVGATVQEATVRAIRLQTIAAASVAAHQAGSDYQVSPEEIEELMPVPGSPGARFAEREVWLHYERMAAAAAVKERYE